MYPGLRLTSFIRWIYKSATSTYGSMRELLKTGIFVVLLKLNEAEYCCFGDWSLWQQSSLTCGQVCKHRTRNIVTGLAASWAADCNYDHFSCPSHEFQSASCDYIECRKFYLNNVQSYLNFFVPNFLNPLIQNLLAFLTDWSDWSICPVTCGTGIQSRERSCVKDSQGEPHIATAGDYGCADGYRDGYQEDQDCSTQSCGKFLAHLCQDRLS